ncbi:MAG: ParB family transcriptional regulator, chromosome partitioning protein [Verrucomicrobiota bacterium]|jgi:ParB family chromosome partitioning protein
MTTAPKLKWREVAISQIDVPREYVRKQPNDDADKALAASVKLSGIHQPLAVIPSAQGRFTLVKGTRRIAAAEENGLDKVPVIVNFPPPGTTGKALKDYRNRLRFILDSKRQDLTPSQEVAVIEEAQRTFKLNNKEIAALLGWDPATVTNKKRINHYAKPIRAAIDNGEISLHHAFALDGLRPAAQVKVFSEMRSEFLSESGRKVQGLVRKRYAPSKHPEMWDAPDKSAEKISKRVTKRKQLIQVRSTPVSAKELDSLNSDLEMLQTEFEDNKAMIEHANVLLQRVGVIHRAVSNDETLLDYVSAKWPEHVPALERFSELV